MTTDERSSMIQAYGLGPRMVAEALGACPAEMWDFRPAPDRWTVREIVHHMADSEANAYIRCRRLIAEPSTTLMAYDQELWAHRLNYQDRDPEMALELFRLLRLTTYELLTTLSSEIWTTAIVHHPEQGLITLEDWLRIYVGHVSVHVIQIQGNLRAWEEEGLAFQYDTPSQ